MVAKFGIGQAVRRVEDQRFLTGKGQYVDDINLPHQAYGVSLLSPYAHARINAIDTSKAETAPGVLLVMTGADAKAEKLGCFTDRHMPPEFGTPTKVHRTLQPILNAEKVRFVGEQVAYVVAETLAQARDAAELVEVDYGALPAVVNLEDAVKPGAPKVFEESANGNIAFALAYGNKEATDAESQGVSLVYVSRTIACRPTRWSRVARSANMFIPTTQYTLYTTFAKSTWRARRTVPHLGSTGGDADPCGLSGCRRWFRPQGVGISR